MRDTTPQVRLTWQQMDELLQRFGYVKQEREDVQAYREDRTDTTLLFPRFPAHEAVAPHHLLQARWNSVLKGVVGERDFDSQLAEVTGAVTARAAA